MEKKFVTEGTKQGAFVTQEDDRITHLQLNPDNTFVYYALVSDQNYYMAIGNYAEKKQNVFLHWDSLETTLKIRDSVFYKKYSPRQPKFLAIQDTMYSYNEKRTVLNVKNLYDRVEIFFKSTDVFTHGLMIDSLKDFPWPARVGQKSITLHRKFGKNITIPVDSVWGIRIFAPGLRHNIYRLRQGYSDLRISYYGDLVIYHTTCAGCPDAGYFSETLDSEVVPLTMMDIRQHFSANNSFLKLFDEDKLINFWNGPLVKNPATGEYRLIEIYRQTRKR